MAPSIAGDHGHLLIDFPIVQIDIGKRKAVGSLFDAEDYPATYSSYIAIAIIQATDEFLIVPPEYGLCTIAMKSEAFSRPPAEHVNNSEALKIIAGD